MGLVTSVGIELGTGDVEPEAHVVARPEAGCFDRPEDELDGLFVRFELGAVTPFVGDEHSFIARRR